MNYFRKNSQSRYRCDICMKYRDCSHFWTHGVVVPESMFPESGSDRRLEWREAKESLNSP